MREITDIKEIHEILYDVLCYFADFCAKYGLTYFLSNGTLLGAAKYGDFIPWDDDVDVLMPREDYDKLVNLKEINNEKYRLFCREQDGEWRMPYAKLSCEQTVIDEAGAAFGNKFGLNVDVFPIDNWSTCTVIAKLQSVKCELLKRMLVAANSRSFVTDKTGIKRGILYVIWHIGKNLGYSNINESIEKMVRTSRKSSSSNVGCIVWTCHMTAEVLPASLVMNTVNLTFRGRSFPTFNGYEEYLERLYGAWKEELPPDKRHSNHRLKVWWNDDKNII